MYINDILCRNLLHHQGTFYLVGEVLEVCTALGIGTCILDLALYALQGKQSHGARLGSYGTAQSLETVDEQNGQCALQSLAVVANALAVLCLGKADANDVGNVLVGRVEVVQTVQTAYEQ